MTTLSSKEFNTTQLLDIKSIIQQYGKKTWKAEKVKKIPIINVSTNVKKNKSAEKKSIIKINDNFYLENNYERHKFLEKCNYSKTENKNKLKMNAKKDINNSLVECFQINTVISTKQTVVQVTKNSNKSSENIENLEQKETKNARKQYIEGKYWYLWRNNVKQKVEKNFFKSKEYKKCNSNDDIIIRKARENFKPKIYKKQNSEGDLDNLRIKQEIIINAQKEKIVAQNKLIEDLKLTKLKLENEKSSKDSQQILEETLSQCDKKLKGKIKSLINLNQSRSLEKYKLQWEGIKTMEARAKERREKWNTLREKRAKQEREKEERQKAALEEKLMEQERNKQMKFRQLKEELKRKAELRERQVKEREQIKLLNNTATEFYRRSLLSKGLDGFKEHTNEMKNRQKQAEIHYNRNLLFKYIIIWDLHRKTEINRRTDIADRLYKLYLIRRGFDALKEIRSRYLKNIQAAVQWDNKKCKELFYKKWQYYVYKKQKKREKKENLADLYYKTTLVERVFQCWRKFPYALKQEKEKELRLQIWRKKVRELLPDFGIPIVQDDADFVK